MTPDAFGTDPAEHEVPVFDLSIEADRRGLVFWWARALHEGTLAEQGAMIRCLDEHMRRRSPHARPESWLTGLREKLWPVYAQQCEQRLEDHRGP